VSHALQLPCDVAAIQSGHAADRPAGRGVWILAATIVGSSMAFIDGTVVSVALPSMGKDLGASAADLQWVVEAYSLFLSALLLVGGALGDRFGRKRIFGAGIALFALASLACALAPSMALLILARAAQGVGGALLVPGSLALISASFDAGERGRAIGTWSAWSGITTALGPLVGGWLVSLSWRWAFLLNLPLALVVLLLLTRVPESKNPHARALDPFGAGLATLGLGGIVYGLIESSRRGFADPAVVAALVLGIAALVAFLVVESRLPAPMLPLALFRSRAFLGANLVTFFLYGALATVFLFLPLDLIEVQGYTPFSAGAAILPLIVILFALSRAAGAAVDRIGPRVLLIAGPTLAAAGFCALSLPGVGGAYARTFLPGLLILGFGLAASVAPLTTTVMGSASEENAGIASGVNNAVSRAAGLIAIAALGILLTTTFDRGLERRLAALGLAPQTTSAVMAQKEKLAALVPPPGSPAEPIHRAALESFADGFRLVARASAMLALLAAASAWIWIPGWARRPQPRGTS